MTAKKFKGFRLTDDALKLLELIHKATGSNETTTVERGIRLVAKAEGVELPETGKSAP